MFIEILNYGKTGCKAKCPTCPWVVSGPNNGPHAHLMFEAFNKLKNKFPDEEIPFSLMNDITDLPTELEKFSFDIKKIDATGCNIKFPFNPESVAQVFTYLESAIPNVKLSLFLENRGVLTDYITDIFKLLEIFTSSQIKDLSISCHNNSMRTNIYDQNIGKIFESNVNLFKQILLMYPPESFQKSLEENLIVMEPKNYRQFLNSLSIKFSNKNLKVSERILGFEENVSDSDDLLSFYKDFFKTEFKGRTFNKKDMSLAFTSIGIRVNHRSIDIKNPYLWLNYDEFFELLEMANTFDDLCAGLKTTISKTQLLSCKVNEISYETIAVMANARKELTL